MLSDTFSGKIYQIDGQSKDNFSPPVHWISKVKFTVFWLLVSLAQIVGEKLSLLKWREFCHLFQEVIDSLIFVLCFWINIALRLMNVFRFTHSHKYTHKWKQQRKKQFLFEFCSFYEFIQSLFCTLILFPARFLFYTSYKMDIWGKLMPFHTRFVVIDAVRNLDIDFLVFLDSSMSFILFFIINGVSLAMSNSCWNCL